MGFQVWSEGTGELRPGFEKTFGHDILLVKETPRRAVVELHWRPRLAYEYASRLSEAWLWTQTYPTLISGHPARLLNPEANVLYLALHLCNHYPRLWGWLCDIRELFHRQKVDVDNLVQSAEQFRARPALRLALAECQALFPAPEIASALERIDNSPMRFSERAFFQLSLLGPRSRFANILVGLVMLPDWASRFRFLSSRAFPSASYLRRRYNLPADAPVMHLYLYHPFEGLLNWLRAQVARPTRH